MLAHLIHKVSFIWQWVNQNTVDHSRNIILSCRAYGVFLFLWFAHIGDSGTWNLAANPSQEHLCQSNWPVLIRDIGPTRSLRASRLYSTTSYASLASNLDTRGRQNDFMRFEAHVGVLGMWRRFVSMKKEQTMTNIAFRRYKHITVAQPVTRG